MPKDYRKEISFQAGELSPLFYGRSETEFYQKGLAIAKNVIIDKRGGALRRGGLANRGQVAGNDARVFTKQIHQNRFDTLIVRNNELVIIAPGIDFQSANLVANPKFASGATSWTTVAATTASRAIFTNNICKLRPEQNNSQQLVSLRQQVTVTAATSASHTVRVQQAKSERLRIKIGTTSGDDDIAEADTEDEIFDLAFVPNNATYWITVESDGANSPGNDIVFVGSIATADLGGLGKAYAAPWAEAQLEDIHTVESPDGEALYMLHPNVSPRKVTYDFATDTYTAVTNVTFTATPAEWGGVNYPATGTYFQGRLWLAGTPNEPQTIWASKSGTPEDFTTGVGAADSWNFTLQRQGRIKWLFGNKDLIVGAENGEHVIESQDGVLTPSDFQVQQQSSYGSNQIQSIQVGEKLFFVTPDGRKLNSMSYAWQEDNWLSQDLTFASEHITAGIIRRRIWAQNPDNLFLVVLEDGTMACMTYDRTAETIGWTDFEYTGAFVIDAAVGQIAGTARMVQLNQRTADEIEVEFETSERIYMDSYAKTYHKLASTSADGLDHLEGEEVQVLIDGAVGVPQTVSGGAITTTEEGNAIIAGKMFTSTIKTLPPDVPQDQIRSWKKRWNKVWARVYNSVAPLINGKRAPDRNPSTPMGQPEPFTSTAYKVVNLGWDEEGQVEVSETEPLPMNVLAIYGELSRNSI